jgi:hypothetical protein
VQADVIRAAKPGTVDVDQLAVEDVLPQQHLLRATVERAEVEPVGRERDAAVPEFADGIAGDKDVASRAAEHEREMKDPGLRCDCHAGRLRRAEACTLRAALAFD